MATPIENLVFANRAAALIQKELKNFNVDEAAIAGFEQIIVDSVLDFQGGANVIRDTLSDPVKISAIDGHISAIIDVGVEAGAERLRWAESGILTSYQPSDSVVGSWVFWTSEAIKFFGGALTPAEYEHAETLVEDRRLSNVQRDTARAERSTGGGSVDYSGPSGSVAVGLVGGGLAAAVPAWVVSRRSVSISFGLLSAGLLLAGAIQAGRWGVARTSRLVSDVKESLVPGSIFDIFRTAGTLRSSAQSYYRVAGGEAGLLHNMSRLIVLASLGSLTSEVRTLGYKIMDRYKLSGHDDDEVLTAVLDYIVNESRFVWTKDNALIEEYHSPVKMARDILAGEIVRGDCDDLAILLGAVLMGLGIPSSIVVSAVQGQGAGYVHVYLIAYPNGERMAVDYCDDVFAKMSLDDRRLLPVGRESPMVIDQRQRELFFPSDLSEIPGTENIAGEITEDVIREVIDGLNGFDWQSAVDRVGGRVGGIAGDLGIPGGEIIDAGIEGAAGGGGSGGGSGSGSAPAAASSSGGASSSAGGGGSAPGSSIVDQGKLVVLPSNQGFDAGASALTLLIAGMQSRLYDLEGGRHGHGHESCGDCGHSHSPKKRCHSGGCGCSGGSTIPAPEIWNMRYQGRVAGLSRTGKTTAEKTPRQIVDDAEKAEKDAKAPKPGVKAPSTPKGMSDQSDEADQADQAEDAEDTGDPVLDTLGDIGGTLGDAGLQLGDAYIRNRFGLPPAGGSGGGNGDFGGFGGGGGGASSSAEPEQKSGAGSGPVIVDQSKIIIGGGSPGNPMMHNVLMELLCRL